MPKCGGSAMKKVLAKWFALTMDYISLDELWGRIPIRPPIQLSTLNENSCLCSHFEIEANNLFNRYPEITVMPHRYWIFSLVRDPFDLRMSLYYYEIKAGRRDAKNQSLVDYLKTGENYIAKRFACSDNNYKSVLGRYSFIGLQEHLQETVDYLAFLFNKPSIFLEKANVAPRDNQFRRLSSSDIETFIANNRLDYTIYDYVKRRFYK